MQYQDKILTISLMH